VSAGEGESKVGERLFVYKRREYLQGPVGSESAGEGERDIGERLFVFTAVEYLQGPVARLPQGQGRHQRHGVPEARHAPRRAPPLVLVLGRQPVALRFVAEESGSIR